MKKNHHEILTVFKHMLLLSYIEVAIRYEVLTLLELFLRVFVILNHYNTNLEIFHKSLQIIICDVIVLFCFLDYLFTKSSAQCALKFYNFLDDLAFSVSVIAPFYVRNVSFKVPVADYPFPYNKSVHYHHPVPQSNSIRWFY